MKPEMNHGEYQKHLKTLSREALLFTIRDCSDCIRHFPESENAGYYQDEISYCIMELARRKK